MKKLLLIFLSLLYLATTFQSDNPPGWYQKQLPLSNVTVQDIYFIDSLNGWVSAMKNSTNDTAYIFNTTDGGESWTVQFKDSIRLINAIQFLDENTGYGGGGFGIAKFLKTTNGGINWLSTTPSGIGFYSILDLKFVNKDTGWICSDDDIGGGIFRTTNGGVSWNRQTGSFDAPIKLFFLNKDTGWALSNSSLYKTTNSGVNWNLLSSLTGTLKNLFFLSNDTGWIIRQSSQSRVIKTTNGGLNWKDQLFQNPFGNAEDLYINSNNKGWISSAPEIFSLANDSVWGKQNTPVSLYKSIFMSDTNTGYSGGIIFVKTEDGGGIITNISQSNEELPSDFVLYQNYPNPFNSSTIIRYEIQIRNFISLKVYDNLGKEIQTLVNSKQDPGMYEVKFESSHLSSGVYYYSLKAGDKLTTKKMIHSK